MTVSLRERVKLYECAINKSTPSNWCTATSITSIRCSVEWPSIHGTIHSHQFSLDDNPIGAFRRVCREPLRETLTTLYHGNYTRIFCPYKKTERGNHTYFRRAEKLQAVWCDRSHTTQPLAHWRPRRTTSLISTHWFSMDFCKDRRVLKTHGHVDTRLPQGIFYRAGWGDMWLTVIHSWNVIFWATGFPLLNASDCVMWLSCICWP